MTKQFIKIAILDNVRVHSLFTYFMHTHIRIYIYVSLSLPLLFTPQIALNVFLVAPATRPAFARRLCAPLFAAASSRNAIKRNPPPTRRTAGINPHSVEYRGLPSSPHCSPEGLQMRDSQKSSTQRNRL